MDAFAASGWQQDQHQKASALARQVSAPHACAATCHVELLFGNVYQCRSSGHVHVCDANCSQRVYNDRYSTVCVISRKTFPVEVEALPCRKRGDRGDAAAADDDDAGKRTRAAGVAAAAGGAASGGDQQQQQQCCEVMMA